MDGGNKTHGPYQCFILMESCLISGFLYSFSMLFKNIFCCGKRKENQEILLASVAQW